MFLHTLPAPARQLLGQIGQLESAAEFYLAGGSAAALHLGHRISVDLDFFCRQNFQPEPLVQQVASLGHLVIQQQSPSTVLGLLNDVRVSFFAYPYPVLEPCVPCEGAPVASLLDISLMKWIAVAQRGRKRDFVDLFFICQSGRALASLLKEIPRKFPEITYPAYHLLRSLTYFDDAEQDPNPQMLLPWDWTTTKKFFELEAIRLVQSLSSMSSD